MTMLARQFTVIKNSRGLCCKTLSVNAAGKLEKSSAAQIAKGVARRVSVESLAGFIELRGSLSRYEALCYGVFDGPAVQPLRLKSNPAVEQGEAIARTRDHFRFPDPAILFIDCDGSDRNALELDAIIGSVWSEWLEVERVWEASSGSFICTADGEQLTSGSGWHAYALVDRGAVIPELVHWLHRLLWKAGYGHIEIAKNSCALLERGLIDVTSAQPERLDFVAPAQLLDGLTRRAPEPLQLPGRPVLETIGLALDEGNRLTRRL